MSHFVVCLDNHDHLASLERGKLYLALDDAQGSEKMVIRLKTFGIGFASWANSR